MKLTEKDIERFWSKVNKDGPLPDQSKDYYKGLGQCWEWTAHLDKCGYGSLQIQGKSMGAHRAAHLVSTGSLPSGVHIMHKCDNPACVNPSHLSEGNHQINMQDRKNRDRGNRPSGDKNPSRTHPERKATGDRNGSHTKPEKIRRGESNGRAKITVADVEEIDMQRQICPRGYSVRMAKRLGISVTQVCRAALRHTWKHIPIKLLDPVVLSAMLPPHDAQPS